MKVTKRNGEFEELSFDKVLKRLRSLKNIEDLKELTYIDSDVISKEVIRNIYDGVKTSELDEVAARICIGLSTDHPEYSDLASRIIISNMHKNTLESFSDSMEILYNNKNDVKNTGNEIQVPLVSEELINTVRKNKKILDDRVDCKRDYFFDYFGFKTLERSYLLKIFVAEDNDYKIIERPQYMWLRVSLGIHKNDITRVLETYELLSNFYFTHASPTLFNSGTPTPQLSSCFLIKNTDSMSGIYKCISDCALISKHAGGIGIHTSNVRSKGSYIKGTNGRSDGIVKMLKVFNETARFANQGSKRNGSFAVYLEPFHADIFEFLELRKNSGDENLRARDLFYALWVNDLFMEAVEKDTDWYLMSEDICPRLTDVYGEEFRKLYNSYVERGLYVKKIKARDLWTRILISQIETGMPYMTYKDHINEKSNQKNIGVIKSSNLCVSPETKILTSQGYYEIKSLENQEVEVWNGDKFSKTTVLKTGENQELLKITFSNGSEIECTPYHKFYIVEGGGPSEYQKIRKIEAKELKPDMRLIKSEFPVIKEGCDSLVFPYENGLFSLNSDENMKKNTVPVNYNLDTKLRWLEGYVDSNGYVVHSNKLTGIQAVSINKKFIDDVKYLLQTLGCDPKITGSREEFTRILSNGKYEPKLFNCEKSYRILITSHDTALLVSLGFSPKRLKLSGIYPKNNTKRWTRVKNIEYTNRISDTYCFNEPEKNMGVFNGVLAGNCAEITLVSNENETAVCNICTFSLPKYVNVIRGLEKFPGYFDHQKLFEVVKVATKNMNNVIDYNFYPVPETKTSNFNHRPIAMGIQGLANVFFKLKIPFESSKARIINKEIMETIQYAGWTASMEIAKEKGETYSTYKGSPISNGIFQHNMWGIDENSLSGRWDWEKLRNDIKKYGVMNSMITALPPTASTSQILGNYESFEPQNSNMFMRSTLSGDFPVINSFLIKDLIELDLWNEDMKKRIINNNGSVQKIDGIPQNIKDIYKTIWEVSQKTLIDMSVDRSYFVDQTQSLNIYMEKPTISKLSSCHFHSWKSGCKTGMYYLRSKSASQAQKFTVDKSIQEEQILQCSIDNKDACEACSG